MPQPKSSSTRRSTARKPATNRPSAAKRSTAAARKPAAAKRTPAAARKPAPAKRTTPAAPKPAAPKRATAAARKPAAAKRASTRAAASKPAAARRSAPAATGSTTTRDDAALVNLTALRERLADGVVLTAQRIQEVVDDAVERGRMTRRDAEDLAKGLIDVGRKQTADVLTDIERLLDRSRSDLGTAAKSTRGAAKSTRAAVSSTAKRARSATTQRGDRVLREVDRVRRGARVGPSFPILGYDDLSASQITGRLTDLKPAELRKVRDHERRHNARKSVLAAIERKLA